MPRWSCAGSTHACATGPTLAQVLEAALPLYRQEHVLLPEQWKVIRAITACRTLALGAHCYRCQDCGRLHFVPHSCRNRHCPLCQKRQAAQWLERQEQALLPVPYFHLVFTVPHALNPLVRQNRQGLYNLLFTAASQTLLQFGQQRLGGQIGLTAVLHTWGQNLNDHYHLHCLVTGGAWNAEQNRWQTSSPHFLFPVRALSKMFRAKFLQGLENNAQDWQRHGQLSSLREPGAWSKFLHQLARTAWVVYAKRPFAGPETVLRYLSRYTHRVAITSARLRRLDLGLGNVSFDYKDYAAQGIHKEMTLGLPEFLRRFLLHLLPRGFVKIRHFGILGARGRTQRLATLRRVIPTPLNCPRSAIPPGFPALALALSLQSSLELPRCPHCQSIALRLVRILRPGQKNNLDSS